MTIVTTGTDRVVEQITKQLNKLIDVVKLLELTDGPHIEREMLLLKVAVTTEESQQQLRRLLEVFKGHLIDHTSMTMTIQLTQTGEQIDSFITALTDYEILETVRSGVSGIARGDKYLKI
jgi:acetolactate synthase-1/3 small subunit